MTTKSILLIALTLTLSARLEAAPAASGEIAADGQLMLKGKNYPVTHVLAYATTIAARLY